MDGQTDSTVAIVAIGVAALVGFVGPSIAGVFAHFRQKRQLAHDQDENEAQREHATALELDRHRRELLYEALGVVSTLMTLAHEAELQPGTSKLTMPKGVWEDVLPRLATMRSKLLMCFQDGGPIIETFDTLVVALAQELLEGKGEDGEHAKANEASLAALRQFEDAAREFLRLDDQPAPSIALP